KPLLSHEGANVRIIGAEGGAAAPGPYAAEGQVFQEYLPLADYEGNRPVLGVWMVDAEARGLGIREADGPITTNLSRFLPHAIAV
ncbi:MAG: glutathionylspermidine synthase, partial [Armatimonadota bacterium]